MSGLNISSICASVCAASSVDAKSAFSRASLCAPQMGAAPSLNNECKI